MKLDAYGILEYVIGSEDDFWCFDFYKDGDNVVFQAVINSETGGFIENAHPIATVPADQAVEYAKNLTEEALEWMAMNDLEHDQYGWNQDTTYFWRSVHWAIHGTKKDLVFRIPVEMEKSQINTRNYC